MRKRHIEPPAQAAPPPAPAPEPANDQAACFTVPELCARWKVTRHTVTDAIRDGRLRAFRVGKREYRVLESEVIRYEQQNQLAAEVA